MARRAVNKVRASAPQLDGLVPYDPKYLPAEAYLSANENPRDVDAEVRAAIERAGFTVTAHDSLEEWHCFTATLA